MQRTPARLRERLSGWVIEADPAAAVERRRAAAADGDVDYRRRDDGLVDLAAYGLTGPDAHACLARIRACAAPVGLGDDRPAGKRRLDALVDLLLGRNPLPPQADDENPPGDAADPVRCAAAGSGATCGCRPGSGAACGCRPGSPAPCGAQLTVLVSIGAALGTTDEVAELVGHGPLEPDLLAALLQAAPSLRAAWVDDQGVPVSVSRRVQRPGRDGPEGGASGAAADRRRTTRPATTPAPRRPPTSRRAPTTGRRADETSRCARPPPPRRHPPVPTASPPGSGGSSACAARGASGPAAAARRPRATSTTTWPGRSVRPAPASSARCAAATTGSSSRP